MALPEIIDGIPCYAPGLALANQNFPGDAFNALAETEDRSFWFQSRNRILKRLFQDYLQDRKSKVMDIGCGNGYVLKALSELPGLTLMGADIHLNGLKIARARHPNVEFVQMDLGEFPFQNEFEAIGAFDVLEHISDDRRTIENVFNALKPGGFFFLTVPQHMFLWSSLDEFAKHKRRYSRNELIGKLSKAGFHVSFISSFVFALFPLMILSRLFRRSADSLAESPGSSELAPPFPLNSVLELGMRLDEWLIGHRISLPFGGSLLAVAYKANDASSLGKEHL